MATTGGGDAFDSWLGNKLQNLNPDTDLDVFVQYIRGILETDSAKDEMIESISGILAEITEEALEQHTDEVLSQWNALSAEVVSKTDHDWDEKLSGIIQEQQQCVIQQKELSAEQRARKAAILAQYAEVSDGEVSDEEETANDSAGKQDEMSLMKNMNAQMVLDREKDVREKEKQQAENKRQKDKEDREKQKQKAVDRKEAEKKRTQKGEKKR